MSVLERCLYYRFLYTTSVISLRNISQIRETSEEVFILERCQCHISVSQTNDAFTNLSNFVTYITFNTVTEGYHWITNAKKNKGSQMLAYLFATIYCTTKVNYFICQSLVLTADYGRFHKYLCIL